MLSVDHVQNDGRRERSGNIYSRVLNSRDRARYQALCLNCNQAKGRGVECEHQKEARLLIWQNIAGFEGDCGRVYVGAFKDSCAIPYRRASPMSTAFLISTPRTHASCSPSGERSKALIMLSLKFVTWVGSPPSRGWLQMFETLLRVEL